MNNDSTIDLIIKRLKWLETNNRSNNIVNISKVLSDLSLLAVTLGEDVSNAYRLQSEYEDNYDIAFAQKFSELTKAGTSAAAAKPIVEAELANEKREWTTAKGVYKRLSTFLDRLDKVLDSHRQALSIAKLESKGI
jgi:hypothetical protein